jgi:hypothetical protein
VDQYGRQRAAEVGIPVEVIIMLLGTSLPEDHNSAEDNPMSADYKLPKGVAEVVPEVGADTWEEVEEVEELEQGKLPEVEV